MKIFKILFLLTICFSSDFLFARDIPPLVSVEWLSNNLNKPGIFVLDIRSPENYENGHIPGSLPAPFTQWITQKDGLLLEMPSDSSITDLLRKLGISTDATIIVINKTDTDWNRADAARVAWTCLAAGIKNSSILDGGFNKWQRTGLPITKDPTTPIPVQSNYFIDRTSIITKDEFLKVFSSSRVIDARIPEDYFGISEGKGHIPGARNLPLPWVYNIDGTYRNVNDLMAMATGAIGNDKEAPIITYCEVGGFAAAWDFILSEVLGYRNVRVYDGSFQEWSQDPDLPVVRFKWD